jgi:hypothetical protein
MIAATASGSASVSIDQGGTVSGAVFHIKRVPPEIVDTRGYRLAFVERGSRPRTDDIIPATQLRPLGAIEPTWANAVQTRISKSIAPQGAEPLDRRWLSVNVANVATQFFQVTADVLPGEPYIYSSNEGDLVAEFSGTHGTMTNIISPTFIFVFAVIDGESVEKHLDLENGGFASVRSELSKLSKMLRTGRHGAVET